jgi:hypothetical protein
MLNKEKLKKNYANPKIEKKLIQFMAKKNRTKVQPDNIWGKFSWVYYDHSKKMY